MLIVDLIFLFHSNILALVQVYYHIDSGPYYKLSLDLMNLSQIMYAVRVETREVKVHS